mmetsp:Transcript_9428/g.22692  ORF Transcript_9428/g.22692 Transcript_9428/m.22692 type:complete len:272 (+) Transcript_9428:1434-2249(+)
MHGSRCYLHEHVGVHSHVQEDLHDPKGQGVTLGDEGRDVYVDSLVRVVELSPLLHLEYVRVGHPNSLEIPGQMIPPVEEEHVLDVELVDISNHPREMQNEPVPDQLKEQRQTWLLVQIPIPLLEVERCQVQVHAEHVDCHQDCQVASAFDTASSAEVNSRQAGTSASEQHRQSSERVVDFLRAFEAIAAIERKGPVHLRPRHVKGLEKHRQHEGGGKPYIHEMDHGVLLLLRSPQRLRSLPVVACTLIRCVCVRQLLHQSLIGSQRLRGVL